MSTGPRLVIDGRRLSATRTGVGRYLETLLASWVQTEFPLGRTLIVLKDAAGVPLVPHHASLEVRIAGTGLPGLLWEDLVLRRSLRPGDVLFAPTNLVPARWRGRTVLVLFDLIQEVRPSDFPWHVRWRFGPRYRQAARRADLVIVPSKATASDAARIYKVEPERIEVIYPGVDPSFQPLPAASHFVQRFRESYGLGTAPYFAFVGKLSKRRHVPEILKGFVEFLERHPGHWLIFAGPSKEVISGLGPSDHVKAIGFIEEHLLRGLLAGARGLLYPSAYEGFGLPVVEAMASGCPVLTLPNSALVESGGEAAFYLSEPTPSQIAAALERLATEGGFREELVRRGLRQAEFFSTRSFADGVARAIRRVANR